MPDGDALKSVYHPYLITKTHWYMPMPTDVLGKDQLDGIVPTAEGHEVYGKFVGKTLTRENIVARR